MISQELACYLYFSDVAEEEEKEAVIREWVRKSGAIVTTSALGVGMDIPDIRLIIHAGCPRSLRDFVQESGRGGRDGQTCKSIVISRLAGSRGPGRSNLVT